MDSSRFKGKVAIVTASTQGIGFAIAERLGLEGASVVVSSRKQKNVEEAMEKLKSKGIEVLRVVCHMSNAQERKDLVEKTLQLLQKYGKIDIVVSNAATTNPSIGGILGAKESGLDKLWEINVKAIILLLQASMVAMYGVTKTALFGLTKALAAEMALDTRVNCIAPGVVLTKLTKSFTKSDNIRKTIEENTLLKRLGTTCDMAAATAFLASEDASYITGETLVVAGGAPSRL